MALRSRGLLSVVIAAAMPVGCAAPPKAGPEQVAIGPGQTGYEADVAFVRGKYEVLELHTGAGRIAVVPALQGRVLTSSFSAAGPSLGAVNREAIEAGERDIPFNDYGGQDRFWLGPEGGPFALFFDAGADQNTNTWRVPDPLHTGPFSVTSHDQSAVRMQRSIEVVNAAGTKIIVQADRTVRPVPRHDAERLLNRDLPESVAYVGFVSENRITNGGAAALARETGTVCVWSVGQFPANGETVVIMPYRDQGEGARFTVCFTTEPGREHIKVDNENNVVLFRANGQQHWRVSQPPEQSTGCLGAVDLLNGILTVVHFDPAADRREYVNGSWQTAQPLAAAGDVASVSNSGPGMEHRVFGLETVSPAAFLAPGASLAHHHRTLHFAGPDEPLSRISEAVLGVSLERVRSRMP